MENRKNQEEKNIGRLLNTMTVLLLFVLTLFLYMDIGITYEKDQMAPTTHRLFGATYMTMNNAFFSILNEEIQAVAEENGDRLITLDPALDPDKQNEEMERLIEQKVDAIFLNPADWKKVKPALESAKKASIPVIVVDTPVYDEDLVNSTIISDNYSAGVQCANHMMNLREKADILLITHPNARSAQERIQGFLDTIEELPQYRVVASENSQGQIDRAFPKIQRLLEKGISFDVVMALNDPSAMGAMAALDSAGMLGDDILVYGVDGSPEGKRLILDRQMTATALQSPRAMGQMAIEAAYKILAGQDIEKEIIIPVRLIDQNNIKDYPINGWQ